MHITMSALFTTFALIFLFLYITSARFRFYTVPFVYVGLVSIISALYIPYALLDPRNVVNAVGICNICKHVGKLMGIKYIIRGKQHLAFNDSCVYVANHQSYIDGLGMFTVWNIVQKCSPVIKKAMLYCGPSGIISWLCGLTFIDKNRTDEAKHQLKPAFENLMRQKAKIWIYPEGTRNTQGDLGQFKKGAFHLAIDAQVPIVPVVFSRYYFVNHETKEYNSGKIIVTALPPISTEGYTKNDLDELILVVRSNMNKVYEEVNLEIAKSLAN